MGVGIVGIIRSIIIRAMCSEHGDGVCGIIEIHGWVGYIVIIMEAKIGHGKNNDGYGGINCIIQKKMKIREPDIALVPLETIVSTLILVSIRPFNI